jgi:hypothetical protein
LTGALARYRAALALARNDPDLEQTVNDLAKIVEPPVPTESSHGLSFEQMQDEFLRSAPPPPPRPKARPSPPAAAPPAAAPPVAALAEPDPRPLAVLAALEQFLGAIHVARAQRRA